MIKKITILAFFFVCVGAVAATKMYVDTEQKYIFTAENLAQTIPDFVTDDAAQVAMAKKYTDIMNQETGAVSVADLFAICRAGGMNTYRAAGFETCRNFVTKLLENASVEFDAESIGGFCPGLDENGKNPNALRSITDKTQVGDFCSSQNIAAGEVVFRRGYNCTCAAYACNPGYESKGGACVTIVADAKGNCFRQVYTVSDREKYKPGESLKFCESKAVGGCKMHNALKNFPSAGKITCNATPDEYASVVSKTRARNTPCPEQIYPASAQNNNNTRDLCYKFCSAKATANNCKHVRAIIKHSTNQCVCNASESTLRSADMYKYVCAGDKGQTGGTEHCVDNVFNWTNVQMLQAVALAQSYARRKYSQSIVCSNKYRKSGNDDYLQCKSTVGNTYYEFQFDDIKETWDSTIDHNVRTALCEGVYGGDIITFATGDACQDISQATCTKLNTSAAKFGYKVTWKYSQMKKKNICMFGDAIENGEKLAQVDGIDPYHFFEGIQIQANRSLIDSLKSYVQTVYGAKLTSFTCLNHFRHVEKIENHVTKGASEDILRCTINGKTPVDFVFDDTSEFADTLSEGGYQNIDCRVIGGEYNGHDCMYLNKQQCEKLSSLNATKCPTCKKIRWDGTYCVMPSAADATELQNTLTNAAIAGGIALGLLVTAATGGAGGAVALATIEMAGSMVELVSTMDIQDKIAQFLKESQKCQNAQCAERMLANDLQRMANLSSDATDAQIVGIDAEFARLIELIPSDSEFYKKIMAQGTSVAANQKGIFDPDSWEPEQMWRAIGLTAQLTSIGKSIFGWAGRKLTKATTAVRRGLRNASHITNATGTTSRNASRAADATTDAERVAGNVTTDAARTGARTADAATDAARTADTASDAGRAADATTDAGRATDNVGGVSQTKSFEERAEFVAFDKGVDEFNRSGVSMSIPDEAFTPDEWAALNRRAASKGVEVLEDGHGGRYFSRIGTATDDVADAATDAARTGARTADATTDAARAAETVTDASRAADGVGESFRGMSYEERLKHIEFNKGLDEFKRNGVSMIFPDEALSPQEWAALKRSLAGDGIELVRDEKYAIWSFRRIGTAADDVADAARTGARTADAATDAARAAETVTDASRAADDVGEAFRGMSYEERLKHIEFNKGLDEFKRNGVSMIFPDEALSPQEWAALKRSLAGDGIELVYDEKYAFWSFRRIGSAADNVADAATDAARTGARTADSRVVTGDAPYPVTQADRTRLGLVVTDDDIIDLNLDTPLKRKLYQKTLDEHTVQLSTTGRGLDDEYYGALQEEFWRDMQKSVRTDAEAQQAYSKYHNKMLDYLETKLDMNRVRTVAQDRRATYMNIIAGDKNLSDQALNWSRLSERQQQQFMQTLVNRVNDGYGSGNPLRVTFEHSGNSADNMAREINIDFTQRRGLRSDGVRQDLNIRNNFDDAMLALSHEHAHSITRFTPDNGALPKDYIGAAVMHLETEGNVFETAEKTRNYLRSIYEKEGFAVGETVSKNFTRDLKRMVGRR